MVGAGIMKNKDRYDMNRLSVHIEPQGYLGTQLEIIYDNATVEIYRSKEQSLRAFLEWLEIDREDY